MDASEIFKQISIEKKKLRVLKESIVKLENGTDVSEEIDAFESDHTSHTSEYKARYENQVEQNRSLAQEVESLKKKLEEEKAKYRKLSKGGHLDEFQGAEGKRLLLRMQREKTNLESQLKDYEWRLDQEATMFHRIDEKRKDFMRDMNRAKSANKQLSQSASQSAAGGRGHRKFVQPVAAISKHPSGQSHSSASGSRSDRKLKMAPSLNKDEQRRHPVLHTILETEK